MLYFLLHGFIYANLLYLGFSFFFQPHKNVKTAAETPTKGLESIFVNWLIQEMYIMVYWQKK